jgi:uncharacterized repeat protein (TIGR03803 family)
MKCFAAGLVLLCTVFCHAADRYSLLYQFDKGANDSNNQESIRPLLHSNTVFAATRGGGANNKGTLFRVNPDGTDYKLLHEFAGGDADGHSPCGTLIADSDTLFGMTTHGGRGKGGTIYSLRPDGSDFTVLHRFEGWYYDGDSPYGSLTLENDKLYGLTARGGTNDSGVLFCMAKDGTAFTLLRTFTGGRTDGATPYGSLTADADAFYGMTSAGGSRNKGIIFRIAKEGADYRILHHFTGGFDNGSTPAGTLLLHGDNLYGMTTDGGTADNGVIFTIRKDGTGFRILQSFAGHGADGSRPHGALVLHNDTLYGKRFTVLRRFADPLSLNASSDGIEPYGSLTVHQDALYGLTRRGGKNGGGVLFRYQLTIP